MTRKKKKYMNDTINKFQHQREQLVGQLMKFPLSFADFILLFSVGRIFNLSF